MINSNTKVKGEEKQPQCMTLPPYRREHLNWIIISIRGSIPLWTLGGLHFLKSPPGPSATPPAVSPDHAYISP